MNTTGAIAGSVLSLAIINGVLAFAPVTIGMRFYKFEFSEGIATGHVIGRKIKDCTVVKDSFVGWQLVGDVWLETPFDFIDDPSPNSTRPHAWQPQDFGLWQWRDVTEGATALKMSMQHDCGGALTVTQAKFSIEGEG